MIVLVFWGLTQSRKLATISIRCQRVTCVWRTHALKTKPKRPLQRTRTAVPSVQDSHFCPMLNHLVCPIAILQALVARGVFYGT